jgi:hypothetical protein
MAQNIPDVNISIGSGLGRRTPSEDNISGMVMQGVATTATLTTQALALLQIVELNGVSDAEGYGLNDLYDETNKVLVYHHIKRFFKRNKSATLYLMLVSQTTTLTQICDKAQPYLKTLLSSSATLGKIKQVAVCLNPLTTYTASSTAGGLDADVLTSLPKAQELANEEFTLFRPVLIVVEGRQFSGTASAATDLRALGYANVAVVIAQDKAIADKVISSTTPYKYYAAIGDTLGMISFASVNENIGWPDRFQLTDTLDGTWMFGALSSNVDVASYESSYNTLHNKGYLYAITRVGVSGYFFQSAPVCNLITADLSYIENTRTINKAARLIRTAMIGSINSPIQLTAQGKMQLSKVAALEAIGKTALENNMLPAGEISSCSVYIDPDHNFITDGEQFDVEFDIVPIGVARQINAKVQLSFTL